MSEQGMLHSREIKVGLAVITMLSIALGAIAFRKFGGERLPPAQIPPDALTDPLAGSLTPPPGSAPPTVLPATATFAPSSGAGQPTDFGGAWPTEYIAPSEDPSGIQMPASRVPGDSPRFEDLPGVSGDEAQVHPDVSPALGGRIDSLGPPDQGQSSVQIVNETQAEPDTPQPSLNEPAGRYDAAPAEQQIPGPLPHETLRQPSDSQYEAQLAAINGQLTAPSAQTQPAQTQPAVSPLTSGQEPAAFGSSYPEDIVEASTGQAEIAQIQAVDQYVQPAQPGAGPYGQQPPVAQYSPQHYRTEQTAPQYAPQSAVVASQIPYEHVVGPGETMWSIARKLYGTGGFFKALAEHNKREYPNPNDLQVGDVIRTPDPQLLREKYPYLSPKERPRPPAPVAGDAYRAASYVGGRTYVVEEGDTLYDIARYELGSGGRWPEIYELNRDRLGADYDYLKPGMQLVVPARTSAPSSAMGPLTQLPGGSVRQ